MTGRSRDGHHPGDVERATPEPCRPHARRVDRSLRPVGPPPPLPGAHPAAGRGTPTHDRRDPPPAGGPGPRVRGSQPHRVLADALAYETRLGRARRVSRGCYAIGRRRHESTERRHRRRLRVAMDAARQIRAEGLGPPRRHPAGSCDTLPPEPAPTPDRANGGLHVSEPQDDRYNWGPLVDDLHRRREAALEMGGAERVERQRSLGKLPVRERLDPLLDPGTCVEYGLLADHMDPGLAAKGYLAADGVRHRHRRDRRPAGRGLRLRLHRAWPGRWARSARTRSTRMRELALRQRIPMVWLLDSAGARIQSASGSTFAGAGALFREQVTMSGVVPQVAAMLGHCAAGTAYIPALADFVPMVKGTSSMALGGRHLVKAASGRGRHRGGDGRLRGPHQDLGRGRPRGRRRRRVPRRSSASTCRSSRRTTARHRRCEDCSTRSTAASRSSTTSCRPRRGAPTTCARSSTGRSSTTATVLRMKPDWAKNIVTGLRPRRRPPVGIVGQPADGARRRARRERGRQGGALRVAVRRVRHPARVPARRARLHRRLRGREAGDHPPRRQDAVRGVARRPCRRSRSSCARATAPATS